MKSENRCCDRCGRVLGGAMLVATLMAAELAPTFCHECGHIDQPHDHREGFSYEFIDSYASSVSGAVSSTITAYNLNLYF